MDYNKQLITFIKEYRKLENKLLRDSIKEIRYIFQNDHLISSWEGRKGNFGDFYLNLSPAAQFRFLEYWQLDDQEAHEYVSRVKTDEMTMLFVTPPPSINLSYQVVLFFYNHPIDSHSIPGIELKDLPEHDKCYGNSANWGDYILSLPENRQQLVLGLIQKKYAEGT
jgi:hypothetical protein